ncbi:MAG TPA: tetratricopeptide repeat protein [Pirellulales bacterium]|jgi:tetratricopeptide (TPR) repeat protein
MATILEALSIALQHHLAGRRAEAEQLYRQVLDADPDQPDALHLLGVLSHESGQHERAVEYISRAIGLRATAAPFYINLGNALQSLGHGDEAAASYQRALALQPDLVEAHSNLGNLYKAQGKVDDAVACYRRALQLRPEFAEAHNNLGNAFKIQAKLDDAVACYRRALAIKPAYAEAHNNLGVTLYTQGKLAEAEACYRQALALQPDYVDALYNLADCLKSQGRQQEAIACYRRAVAIKPDFAEAHSNLGNTLREQGQLPEAVDCFHRALQIKPDFAEAHNNLGNVLRDQDRLQEAAACYRRVLELRPEFTEAKVNLGGMHEQLGELSAAEQAFRAARELQPTSPLPHARLATLLRGRLPDADRTDLENLLAGLQLSDDSRAELSFALAHVYDAQNKYERAADLAQQANALRRNSRPDHAAYRPADHAQFVDHIMRTFDRPFFARMAGAGLDTGRPVFIVGLPRSGTTLLEQVLASHSQIHGAGELRLAQETLDAVPSLLCRQELPLDCVEHLNAPGLRLLAGHYLERLGALDGGRAKRVVDKMPENYLHLGLIATMFPNSVIIHCRRELRDVAVSCWMTDFVDVRWANDFGDIASRFRQYLRIMEHWRATLPVTIHEVDYEDAVADLEPVARRLLTACGVDWEPACLAFHRTQRPIRTASSTQVREPIYTRSVARWRHYERELAALFAALPHA